MPAIVSFLIKILSSFCFTISGILWKNILVENKVNYHLIFYRTLFSISFTLVLIFAFTFYDADNSLWLKSLNAISAKDWGICIVICLFSFWGLFYFTAALKVGRYSFVGALSTTTALFSFITAIILYHENPGIEKWLAFFVIFAAYIFHQKEGFSGLKFSKEVVFLLVSSLFWGISFVFFLIPIQLFGVLYFSLILEICVLISCIFLLILKEKRIFPPKIDSKTLFICSLIGLVICVGSVLSNLSLTQLPVYINISIAISFELLTIYYGIFRFKEKLSVRDWVLIVAVSCGVLVMMF